MVLPAAANRFYSEQQRKTAAVLQAAKTVWGARPPQDFDAWFDRNVGALVAIVITGQQSAVESVPAYVNSTLDELNFDPEVLARPDPSPIVGVASDGRPLDSLLYGAVITAKGSIAQADVVNQAIVDQAWQTGLNALMMRVQLQVTDASRVATSLEITSRRDTGYVRLLSPPSCSRCIVLAGRWYRYSAAFDRHPGCNCRQVPAAESMGGDLRADPMFQFLALTEPEQDKIFTKAGAEAIRAGADINQVVNARRGMSTAQENIRGWIPKGRQTTRNVYGQQLATTDEGVTRRGLAYKAMSQAGYAQRQPDVRRKGERYFRAKAPRLMPESILQIAEDRDDALRLLRLNGYILDQPAVARVPRVNRRAPAPVDLDAAAARIDTRSRTPLAASTFGAEDLALVDTAVVLQMQRAQLRGGNLFASTPEIDALTARLDRLPLTVAARERAELLATNEQMLVAAAGSVEDADRIVALSHDGLRIFAADKDVAISVPSEAVLTRILADGRMRSQRDALVTETGGAAGYVPEQRELIETAWFGPHDEPPIYGYLRDRSGRDSGADEYGDIALVLRSDVKGSTSVVVGDSLGEAAYTFPGPLGAPGRYTANPTEAAEFATAEEYAAHLDGEFYVDYHVEAQIRDVVRVTDIDFVHFKGEAPSPELVERLRAAGVRFTVAEES